jgi:hypothetical protein
MERSSTNSFIIKAKKIHGDKYDYSRVIYTLSNKKVSIICHIHGEFMQTPNDHLNGHNCGKCAYIQRGDTLRIHKNPEQIILDCYERVKQQGLPFGQKDIARELKWNIKYVQKYWGTLKRQTRFGNNLIGQKFGRWSVINQAKSYKRGTAWNCECDCGTKRVVSGKLLRSGESKSCGCYHLEMITEKNTLPDNRAIKNSIFRGYQQGAKDRCYSFNITFEEFETFLDKPCYYCGLSNTNSRATPSKIDGFKYNGIDRYDNNIGYELHNLKTCCKICNQMKMDLGVDEFMEHINRIQKHFSHNNLQIPN